MTRNRNSDKNGHSFPSETVAAVWEKAKPLLKMETTMWRIDKYGKAIKRTEYGKTTQYGWEVDHILPVAKGGGDNLSNLQALQWEINRQKADNYPWNPPN